MSSKAFQNKSFHLTAILAPSKTNYVVIMQVDLIFTWRENKDIN